MKQVFNEHVPLKNRRNNHLETDMVIVVAMRLILLSLLRRPSMAYVTVFSYVILRPYCMPGLPCYFVNVSLNHHVFYARLHVDLCVPNYLDPEGFDIVLDGKICTSRTQWKYYVTRCSETLPLPISSIYNYKVWHRTGATLNDSPVYVIQSQIDSIPNQVTANFAVRGGKYTC